MLTEFTVVRSFPGQYYDAETGHNYNYFRDYDSGTGRYLESDPVGLWGGIDSYTYVLDNPNGWGDHTGLAPGDLPPPPPGYNPKTWQATQDEDGNWGLIDPEGNLYRAHPEDYGHWRHWDKFDPNGKNLGRCPQKSLKPWPGQKRGFKPDQSLEDPSENAKSWEPPSNLFGDEGTPGKGGSESEGGPEEPPLPEEPLVPPPN